MKGRLYWLSPAVAAMALIFLALAYWGRWISHPAAGLNILGVDLPEYVKFVPEVRYGVISIDRLVFFGPPTVLSAGLILFASMKQRLHVSLRILAGVLAIPVALSMLPPAWTPGVLMTPEFQTQTILIMALVGATFLVPLWKHIIPDWLRGIFFILLALMNIPAIQAFHDLLPALEKLYNKPLSAGSGVTFLFIGMGLMILAGGLMIAGRFLPGEST